MVRTASKHILYVRSTPLRLAAFTRDWFSVGVAGDDENPDSRHVADGKMTLVVANRDDANIENLDEVRELFRRYAPDGAINLAAKNQPRRAGG